MKSKLNITTSIVRQIKNQMRLLATVYIILFTFFVFLLIQPYVNIPTLTRDASAVLKQPIYVSIVSDFGMYLWAISMAFSFFMAFTLFKLSIKTPKMLFLASLGTFSLLMLADDRLMVHEELIEKIIDFELPFGLEPGLFVYGFYVLFLAFVLIYFRDVILSSDYILLVVALGFLGLSLGLDLLDSVLFRLGVMDSVNTSLMNTFNLTSARLNDINYLLEDGAKLAGIIGWTLYIADFCYVEFKTMIRAQSNLQPATDTTTV